MITQFLCYCGSTRPFDSCCQPLIDGVQLATTPESLMRARYSAYADQNYEFVLATYALAQRNLLTLKAIQHDSQGTNWLKLEILDAWQNTHIGEVEFCAFYQRNQQLFKLHERSKFCLEGGKWRYISGSFYSDSGRYQQRRNDFCLCASGKKFKKCCALLC